MAAYWNRLAEMRVAYLPRLRQTYELAKRKASGLSSSKKTEQFLVWIGAKLIPLLQQSEGAPCALAKFTAEELNNLEEDIKKLMALTSGASQRQKTAPAPAAQPAGGATATATAAAAAAGIGGVFGAGATVVDSSNSDVRGRGGKEGDERKRATSDGDDTGEGDAGTTGAPPKKVKSENDGVAAKAGVKMEKEDEAAVAKAGVKVEKEEEAEEVKPPVVVKPAAFANLFSCELEATSRLNQPPPPTPHSLSGFTLKPPPPTQHASSSPPAVFEAESGASATAAAVVYGSDDVGYFSPESEMSRRVFEEDVTSAQRELGAEQLTASSLWRMWDNVISSNV